MFRRITTLALVAGLALPSAVQANEAAIGARKALMSLIAFNFAALGGMVQGRTAYDADAAQTAADHLYHLTRFNNPALWPEGSDSASAENTRALPVIWENLEEFTTRFAALQDGAAALQGVAGVDLASLQGAFGGVAGTCQACHQSARAPAP